MAKRVAKKLGYEWKFVEIKYKDAPKNVLERAETEIKKLDCPEE